MNGKKKKLIRNLAIGATVIYVARRLIKCRDVAIWQNGYANGYLAGENFVTNNLKSLTVTEKITTTTE